jgi:hypothetical protein
MTAALGKSRPVRMNYMSSPTTFVADQGRLA